MSEQEPVDLPNETENSKIVYNKLVRDRIPEIIEADGASCETKVLTDEEYINALSSKLSEEAIEFVQATDREEMIKELADLKEVIKSLQEKLGITEEEVEQNRIERREKRGGFDQKIFLVSTEGGNYK